jgi:hypothetical protein
MGSEDTGIEIPAPQWILDFNKMTQDIRSHAFTFKVTMKHAKNWSIRKKLLELAGFKVLPKGGAVPVDMVFFKGYKLWLSKNKLTIYFPDWKIYWSDMARTGYNYAVADLITLLHDLEKVLDSDFRINKEYRFRVSRQHHALVHNTLAKQYNREHKKLEVFDNRGELWLLIDNSDVHNIRMNDLETTSKKSADKDMDDTIKPFFNQLRETQLMPKDILNMIKEIAINQAKQNDEQMRIINDVTANQKVFAENQISHVQAVKILGDAVGKLDKRIGKFGRLSLNKKSIKELKAERVKRLKDKWW